jgi:hypothetical protein
MLALVFSLAAAAAPSCELPEGWLPVEVEGNRRSCACVGLGRTGEGRMEALVKGSCDVVLTVDAASCGEPVRVLLGKLAEGETERRYPLACADGSPLGGEVRSLSARRER